jgi:mannose-6-phosphate isomerase
VANEREERPWGYYEVLDDGPAFRVKRICVHAGQRLSYQRHQHRSEHWYVVAGSGVALVEGCDQRLAVGSTVQVDVGTPHRVANDGDADLVFIEVQTGSYFGEDDIERLDDDYGRHVETTRAD